MQTVLPSVVVGRSRPSGVALCEVTALLFDDPSQATATLIVVRLTRSCFHLHFGFVASLSRLAPPRSVTFLRAAAAAAAAP